MRKKHKTIIVVIIISFVGFFTWLWIKNNSISTVIKTNGIASLGGKKYTQPEETTNESVFTTKLRNSLPYKTSIFTITTYDYSKGKFVVIFENKSDQDEKIFENWLQNSEFSPIPPKRLEVR